MQGESSEFHAVATALGIDSGDFERALPGLNALGKALLVARVQQHENLSGSLEVWRLCELGWTRADCRDLLERGWVTANGTNGASRRIVLANAGLVVLQAAIPLGAIRPVYERASQKLTVAGHTILQPAVHGHNLSAVLSRLEDVG
jgi:hypothetical protein